MTSTHDDYDAAARRYAAGLLRDEAKLGGRRTMTQLQRMHVEQSPTKDGDPELTATLTVQPPRKHPDADPESYQAKMREQWTYGMLEQTVLELGLAGAWDGAKVELSHMSLECEILVGRGGDALPWGYRPITGCTREHVKDTPLPPPPSNPGVVRSRRPSLPWWRIFEAACLIALLVLGVVR